MPKLSITKVNGGVIVTGIAHTDSVRNMSEHNTAVFKDIKGLSAYLNEQLFKEAKVQKKGKYKIIDEDLEDEDERG